MINIRKGLYSDGFAIRTKSLFMSSMRTLKIILLCPLT